MSYCEVCDEALVQVRMPIPRQERTTLEIDCDATIDALIGLVAAGKMRVLRADVPLEDMMALARSDMKYSIESYLACNECGSTKLWGLYTRGAPKYVTRTTGSENSFRWEPVPPRHLWEGS